MSVQKEDKVLRKNFMSGMAAALAVAISLVAMALPVGAADGRPDPEKKVENRKGITVLLPDGSPAISKSIMLIVDVNREVGEQEKMRPYGTFSIPVSKNMMKVVGVTRKVGEMERLGPYGPLSSDEKGFLPLPEEVLLAAEKQHSFMNVGNFFPRIIIYDRPSDSVVLKGGGFLSTKDIFFGRRKSVKLIRSSLDEEEKREFFAGSAR